MLYPFQTANHPIKTFILIHPVLGLALDHQPSSTTSFGLE